MTHVAVTGASSGIGEALVREFVRAGASVTLLARRRDLMEAIAREVGGRTHVVTADLADPAQATCWLGAAEAALGPIDVLINNAGVQVVQPAHLTDPARGQTLLQVDLLVPLQVTRTVLPGMIARGSGTIVDVSSGVAQVPLPGMWYYNAAKAGLSAASESLRGELRKTGVHVVTVYPGPVDTPIARDGFASYEPSLLMKLLPQGRTDVLARLVRRAVERRRARVIYPRIYVLTRYFPTVGRWVVDRLTPPARPPSCS